MRKLAVVALVTVAFTAACAGLAKQAFQNPIVNLRDVRVMSLGASGGNIELHLGVYNPNNYRLDASQLRYNVFVGDSVRMANGTFEPRTSVQAGDSTIVRIPVSFTYAGLGAAASQLLRTGAVNYRVNGDFTVNSVVGNFTVPYSTTGQFNTLSR
jgi:LEA14-like dessication related protein